MDRRLVKTVLSVFQNPAVGAGELAFFSRKQWERSYDWLDTSGMALYLLDRLKQLSVEGQIPEAVLFRLIEKQEDNCSRTEQLFCELAEINRSFQQAGIRYVNLKGITLVPHYCPSPELRFQADLDFLLDASDAELCKEILKNRGYRLTGVSGATSEFKAGSDMIPALRDMYKAKEQRSVEIHCTEATSQTKRVDDRLQRRQMQRWRDCEFPTLTESDKFISQSIHLCRHLRSEWIRLSWVLEYWRFLRARAEDVVFWHEVRERVGDDIDAAIAIGMSSRIAAIAFGGSDIPPLKDWTIGVLPKHFDCWLDRYGESVLLTEFPGSKLYLLLDSHEEQTPFTTHNLMKKLFPLHLPPHVVHCAAGASLRERWNVRGEQMRYFLFRLRFHVITSIRFMVETARWKWAVWFAFERQDLRSKEAD